MASTSNFFICYLQTFELSDLKLSIMHELMFIILQRNIKLVMK